MSGNTRSKSILDTMPILEKVLVKTNIIQMQHPPEPSPNRRQNPPTAQTKGQRMGEGETQALVHPEPQ